MFERKVIDPAGFAPVSYRTPPHNEEAEQTVLGAILVNNKAFERVGEFLRPEHFFDPANQKIFQAIMKMIDRGQVANPITLKAYFEKDADLSEIGGREYLARLAAAIVTAHNLEDYGRVIHDAFLRRQLIEVGEDMVNQAYKHDLETPAYDLLTDAERALFALSEAGTAERRAVSLADASADYLTDLEAVWNSDGSLNGITTGLADLDRRLCGLKPGQLLILAGRPSMGKTALATNIADAAASAGHSTYFASLEMSRKELMDRMVAGRTGIPSSTLNSRNLSPVQKRDVIEAMADLSALRLHIDDAPGRTVTSLRNALRRHKRRHGLDLAVIDYIGLMVGEGRRGTGEANRVQEISEITRGLKAIAKELEVPVLALSQLSRQVEARDDKRPQLSDLRDSGSIEQDADVVMFVFREQYYLERAEPSRRPDETQEKFNTRHEAWLQRLGEAHGLADVIVAKLRQGQIGTTQCVWDGQRQRFSSLHTGAQP